MRALFDYEFVFVYGTLKRFRDWQNKEIPSGFLVDADFIGTGITEDLFEMKNLGSFPAISFAEKGLPVRGEVYTVTKINLFQLDDYESVPHLYERREIPIALDSGKQVLAWTYIGKDAIRNSAGCPFIKPTEGALEWLRTI